MFAFSEQGCRRNPARTLKDTFKVWGGKTSKQPLSLCLCASSAMCRWGWETAFQASSFCLRAICRPSYFQSRAAGGTLQWPPKLSWKFEGARQASSPSLCASVRAVPWADEAEQQLSRLVLSVCELSADICIFGAGLPEPPGTDHLSYVWSLRGQDKQAAPVSVPPCEQCHGQMKLSNSFPG